jgi:hypothetical protein
VHTLRQRPLSGRLVGVLARRGSAKEWIRDCEEKRAAQRRPFQSPSDRRMIAVSPRSQESHASYRQAQ